MLGGGNQSSTQLPSESNRVSILTETEYRQYSGDTRTPWSATGGEGLGAQRLVELAEEIIADYLETFLEPTQVVDEEHTLFCVQDKYMGEVVQSRYPVYLGRVRLLSGYAPSVTIIYQALGSGVESETSGFVDILNAHQSKINIGLGSGSSLLVTATRMKAKVSYWAGFVSLPLTIKRCIAVFARNISPQLIGMEDDIPYGAPMTAKRAMDLSRSFAAPRETPFGQSFWAMEIERWLFPYKVLRARSL